MTQVELAADTDIERTYLARIETGLSTIQVERTLALLRALGVTLTGSMDIEDQPGG